MAAAAADGVKSVARVFDLLELIADAGGSVTLSELSTAAGLPLPTIHRLLRTLVSLGYARQLQNRRYALGPRLVRLGEVANRQFGQIAMPQLKELVERLGETANLATIDGDRVIYVSQAPSPHAMRMFTEVGRRVYMHSSGVGKAILAQLDDAEVRDIIGRTGMPHATENTIATVDGLLSELADIRRRGYAIDEGEQEIGVRCYAMAVPNMPVPTAVSVSGPRARVDDAFGERAIPVLTEVTSEISALANAE
ncbi:IclR family transcriptional regulator [Microbacterium sp. ASV49]|uniref:IclR family transcriptional regulator n=1 Tax=Microbacterium candidum TaxID=3041922 RepID=A0ABT7MYG1_9MICO|nr:IclR family transcriptional regulator [Microbacterium sp. ASV49]MDL9979494.1 IclR family transcriptional regulator [Microbacterium sp. ASV49]